MALMLLIILGCTSSDSTQSPAPDAVGSSTPIPAQATGEPTESTQSPGSHRINLGVAPGRRQGQTPIDALIHVEGIAARRFDVVRAYAFWDSEFPDLRHQWVADAGQTLHLSINARRTDGSVVSWDEIATAREGDVVYAELVDWIERLATHDAPLRVTFHHEADIEPEFGTADDFVAAWQRFTTLLNAEAPSVETVWVLTAFNLDKPLGEQFWPGDTHVDLIGADAFNWYGCRGTPETWRSPSEVLAPLMEFGANHPDKGLVLAELGSDEDPDDPERKAAWLRELSSLIAGDEYRRLDTVVFFHNDHDADSTCDWWTDSSDLASNAFAELSSLALFGGNDAAAPTMQCPVVAMVTSSTADVALVDGDGDGRFDFEFGDTNRFLGLGDQSADGADHRVLLRFDPIGPLPADATLELRIRIGERQPMLSSPVELRILDGADTMLEAFSAPGVVLEPSLFDASTAGGHHVVDVTNRIDPSQASQLRLQLVTAPSVGDGQSVLYMGMGDAARSIDRPALLARHCG